MKRKERIKLTDSTMDVLMKMAEGNPGALTTCLQLIQSDRIDPDAFMGGLGKILDLDRMGIYGTDIYVLWSDICDCNTAKLITVLRAAQLGVVSDKTIADAASRQDYSGKGMIDITDLYRKVRKALPGFDPNDEAGITIIECDIMPYLHEDEVPHS
jgi:hypothetical protein